MANDEPTTLPDGERGRPRRITRRSVLVAAAGVAVAGGATAAVTLRRGSRDPLTDSLVVAGGERAGIYIQFTELLATELINSGVAREATAATTFGSVANLDRIREESADLALAQADAVAAEPDGIATVGRVYLDYLQCVVRSDAALRSVEDLAGGTVSVGPPASGTALIARRVLAALGVGETETTMAELPTAEAVDQLATGALDAVMFSSGVPTPVIAELAADTPIGLLALNRAIRSLETSHPGVYETAVIGRDVYGLEADARTVGVPNLLLCHPGLADDVVAGIVDVLLDSASLLIPEQTTGIQYLTLPTLVDTAPFPLHPGAARRYRERYG